MNELVKTLKEEWKDKETRHVYCDEFLNSSIATQIKVLREQRGLTQTQLAALAGMMQPRIAALEDVNYSSWTINVLRRLAEAFDLTLTVKFESFGEKLHEIVIFSRENLEKPSFEDDPAFQEMVPSVQASAIESVSTELKSMLGGDGLTDTGAANVEDITSRKQKYKAVNALMGEEDSTEGKRYIRRA